jgi:hypothetical protein
MAMRTLSCLSGYTLFIGQIYSPNGIHSVTYNESTADECQLMCTKNQTCGGFNFNTYKYQCQLLFTDCFATNNLINNENQAIGFYMQSYDLCDIENTINTFPFYLFLVCAMIFTVFLCCTCCKEMKVRRRRPSSLPLIETPPQIPPPYQSSINQ